MSERVTLVMEPREETGKGANRRLRKSGYTPCVFYGPEMAASVQGKIKTRDVERLLTGHWETMRLDMTMPDGSEEMCLIREVQVHPLTDLPLHVDFYRLLKGHKITVNIPIEVVGREASPGVKDGGVLEAIHEVEVEVLPRNIPEVIEVDVSALGVGDAIHARDMVLPEGVELLVDPDEIIAVIATSRGVEDAAPAEAEENAEVEVVAKGKAAKEAEE